MSRNPWADNALRKHNKRIQDMARTALKLGRVDGGRTARKRKKHVLTIERANYAALLDHVVRLKMKEAGHERE